MPTYDGTYKLAVEDGRVLIRDVEGGSQTTHVPLEIYSNYAAQGTLTDSRQLRLRTQPYLESNTANAYVTDMGIESKTDNYFFITAPQNTSNVGDQNTFVISSTSNIGIGTTDPTKPLHVVGDSWITGTLTTSNIVGASPVTISSDIVMAAGATLTTSNIVANTGDTFLVSSNLKVGTSNLFVDTTTGRVGIGTDSPADLLEVRGGTVRAGNPGNTTNIPGLKIRMRPAAGGQTGSNYIECGQFADIGNDGSGTDGNRFIVTNSGRVGIGTDSPERRLTLKTNWSTQQYDGLSMRDANDNGFVILAAGSTDAGGARSLGYMRLSGTDGVATNGIFLQGSGSSYINGGNVGIGTASPQTTFQVVSNGTSQADKGAVAAIATDNTSFGGNYALLGINCKRSQSGGYRFLQCNSGYGTSGALDAEFILYGSGNGNADGSWIGGGADYAEMFEWEDGNPDNEDRIGLCVKLSENKIKLMEENDDTSLILGVVSKTGGFIGDAAELKWSKKYLKDDFGRYLEEEYYIYNWTDEDGKFHSYAHDDVPSELIVPESKETIKSNRRILNPEYNPSDEYIPRSNRIEWETIGLFGKIRIRKGQPVKNTWIKLRNISDHVEEWFVR